MEIFWYQMTEIQISSGLRLIVDLNLDKINDMLLIRPKFDIFPPNDFLPYVLNRPI